MTPNSEHSPFLYRALELAKARRGYCAPNPAVGAVIVKEGKIIAEGTHWACGEAHAEVAALNLLGGCAEGATIYVSLEPCCHQGRTPPCTRAILAAGIQQVVYAYRDPNPLVGGKGHQQLLEAGVECLHCPHPEIDAFYQSYQYWQDHKMPWVTAKIALSLDGKIAGPKGERVNITGPALKERTYRYRQRSDAILTTAKTILNDDPFFDIRLENKIENKGIYIIDRELRSPPEAKIFSSNQSITVFYSEQYSERLPQHVGAQKRRYVPVPESPEGLDLHQILTLIGQAGVHDLWCEAGGTLLQSLLDQDAVQTLLFYIAPICLGSSALSAFGSKALYFNQFNSKSWLQVGDDVVCEMQHKRASVLSRVEVVEEVQNV